MSPEPVEGRTQPLLRGWVSRQVNPASGTEDGADDDQGYRNEQMRWDIADAPYQPRSEERRQGGTAHAGAEDPSREASPRRFEPRVDEWDADRECGAGHAKEEAEHQKVAGTTSVIPRRQPADRSGVPKTASTVVASPATIVDPAGTGGFMN